MESKSVLDSGGRTAGDIVNPPNIRNNFTTIKRVKQYQHLGIWINKKHDQTQEIKGIIEKARSVISRKT